MSKITYCDNMMESKDKYAEYINNHIRMVQEAYQTACDAFLDIFPNVYNDDNLTNKLVTNLRNHDKSKFSDEEFWPYAMRFFPINSINPKSKEVEDNFEIAWLHHIHNNPHHPAHWVLADDGNMKILNMPDIYIIEMLCDWMAMSKYHNSTTLEYWRSDSGQQLPMSEYTKSKVDKFMKWMMKNNVHTLW